jgi:hypothetical protein
MKTTTLGGAVAALGLLALTASSAISQDRQRTPYGIYSNMQAVDGEYSGFEVIVLPSTEGDFLVFQEAAGWPGKPVLLPARLGGATSASNDSIRFEHPDWGPFQGVISGDSLAGEFPRASHRILLARGQSIWQR